MWDYHPDSIYKAHPSFGDYKPRRDHMGSLKSKDVSCESKVVRVEAAASRRLKTFSDPWQAVLASDKVLLELGNKSCEFDVAIHNKQNAPPQSLVWLEVRKKHAAQAMAIRIQKLKETDPYAREDDTYFVAVYDGDDVEDDNTCSATIEEYSSFGAANSRFNAYAASWHLVESFTLDTRGLPQGSLCLKSAEVADDARDQDVSVVLARAPRKSLHLFW